MALDSTIYISKVMVTSDHGEIFSFRPTYCIHLFNNTSQPPFELFDRIPCYSNELGGITECFTQFTTVFVSVNKDKDGYLIRSLDGDCLVVSEIPGSLSEFLGHQVSSMDALVPT